MFKTENSSQMDIAIVGAGIGGLAAAGCLLKSGHRVRVYEQAPELGEVGAGVQMSANAVKVLYHLGLEAELEAVGVKPMAFEFRRFDTGEQLHRIPLGETHRQRFGVPYYQMHRVDLHSQLLAAVRALDPDAVAVGARATSVQEDDAGVSIEFDGRQSVRAELAIGADGIKSVVRRHVVGEDKPGFTGQVVWRCMVPVERIPKELRPDVVSSIFCGPNNHGVIYYLRAGTLINFIGCVRRPWEEESWTSCRPWKELDEDYAGWHPLVRAVVENVDKDQCYRWALNNRKVSTLWSTARCTLLGDAVHATLPYMAQGAAMAIEDAAVLTRALELEGSLEQKLRRYQQARVARTTRVVEESTEMGELYQITDAETMRRAFAERNIARSRNEWLYPYDPLTVAIP
jgi:salicylate hydroxylase